MSAVVNVAMSIPILILDANGSGKTGQPLTSTARLVGSTTTISATVTERTNGEYDVAFTPTSVGLWRVISTATVDGSAFVDTTDVQVITAAQADPVSALAGVSVTVTSPVASNGDVTVYQGDDQQAVDSRSLDWSASNWPDLTGASIVLVGDFVANAVHTISATGSVTTPTGSGKAVRVELTSTQTDALKPGAWTIQVIATLANGHVVTLVGGTDDDSVTMTVVSRRGA